MLPNSSSIVAAVKREDYSYFIFYSPDQQQYFSIIENNKDIPQALQNYQENEHFPISVIPILDSSVVDPIIQAKIQEAKENDFNTQGNPNSLTSLFDIFYNSGKSNGNLSKFINSINFQLTSGEYAKAIYGISQAFSFASNNDISVSLSDIFFGNDKLPHVAFCTPLLKQDSNPDTSNYSFCNNQHEYIYKPNETKIALGHILYLLAFLAFDKNANENDDDDDFFLNDDSENALEDDIDGENNEFEDEHEQSNESIEMNSGDSVDTINDNNESQQEEKQNNTNDNQNSNDMNDNQVENNNNDNDTKDNDASLLNKKDNAKSSSTQKVLFNIHKILQIFKVTNHIIPPPFELFPSFIDELVDRCHRPTVPFEWIIDQIALNIEFIIGCGQDAEKIIDDPNTIAMIDSFKQYANLYHNANSASNEANPNNNNHDEDDDDDDIPLRPPAAAPGTFRSFVIQEDLPFKMDPWIYCQTQSIIDMQAILMDTTEETLEENITIFLDSVYRRDFQLIDAFVHYIIIAVFHRPKCIKTITFLVKGIIDACVKNNGKDDGTDANSEEYAQRLKEAILRMTPEKPASSGHYANACGPMNFFYECHQIGIFTDDEIYRLILNLTSAKSVTENTNEIDPSQYNIETFEVRRVGAHLAAYFAPLLMKINPSFLEAIVSHVLTYQRHFPKVFGTTFNVILNIITSIGLRHQKESEKRTEEQEQEDWKPLYKMIHDEKGIRELLQRDDISSLREMAANPSFDINMRIIPSLFDPYFIAADKPTILQYSAFHSALKCFRYLLLNGADTQLQDTLSRTVVHYAIDGGSIEIIRICEQEGLSFDGALEESVKMYQFDIFEWLQGTKYPVLPMNNLKYGSIPVNAARTNNIRMILFSLENGLDINISDQYESFPLLLASLFGYNDVIRLLLTSPNIQVNKQDEQGNTSLIVAIDEGYVDTVKLLLSHKDIDIVLPNNRSVLILICFI